MATEPKKNGDIVINGFENGIADSPHAGIADMKCCNINSFPGEVAVNYARTNALPSVVGGTITSQGANNTLFYSGPPTLVLGSVVLVASSTITNFASGSGGGVNNNYYWVANIPSAGQYQFSKSYNGPIISNFGISGTATFSTLGFSKFIQGTYEFIQSRNQYIYYLVDTNAQVWVNDPSVYGNFSPSGSTAVSSTTNCQGFAVSQGVVTVFVENQAVQKFTNRIGDDSVSGPWNSYGEYLNTPVGSTASHRALRSQVANGAVLYPDSQFIGSIQGANSQFTLIRANTPGGGANVTVSSLDQGVLPAFSASPNNIIVGAYAPQNGALPAELTEGTPYYIVEVANNGTTFQLSTTKGGSSFTISSGSYYITTFDPSVSTTFLFHRQALALPYDEQATALAEVSLGNTVNLVVGGITQNVYFWDESSIGYTTVRLPEGAAGTQVIASANNNAFVFAGNKGNIYLTNGSALAGTMTLSDYCANPNGNNQDPYFIWADARVIRSRIFFSVQDQNSKNTTGNMGGIWSFTLPQNYALQTNIQGSATHLENQSSYGTYNGVCNVILPSQNQQANGPQYFSAWTSDINTPTYGIDISSTSPYTGGQAQIDTNLIPLGTYLAPGTMLNLEYKLSRPLVSGESIKIQWRPDLTSAFTPIGNGPGGAGIDNTIGATAYAFPLNLQNGNILGLQWIQFRINMTSTNSSPSFVPLVELRLYK